MSATNAVAATISLPVALGDPAVVAGKLWVPKIRDNVVALVDPATNKVIQTISVGIRPFPAAAAFGDIWVPSAGGTEVYRLHIG